MQQPSRSIGFDYRRPLAEFQNESTVSEGAVGKLAFLTSKAVDFDIELPLSTGNLIRSTFYPLSDGIIGVTDYVIDCRGHHLIAERVIGFAVHNPTEARQHRYFDITLETAGTGAVNPQVDDYGIIHDSSDDETTKIMMALACGTDLDTNKPVVFEPERTLVLGKNLVQKVMGILDPLIDARQKTNR